MGIDVTELLARYEQAPVVEPMHGQRGEVRRNPSTDQKRERRLMTKKAAEDGASVDRQIAQLLRQASRPDTPLAAQQELMAEVERLKTARLAHFDTEAALDLTVQESVEIIPQGMHEHHTASTDWVLGLQTTAANVSEAEHALVAEAAMWFDRVPDYVKADPAEFRVQATNLARRTASQYGEAAEAAAAAFCREADRLHKQAVKTGSVKVAMQVHDLENGGFTDVPDPTPQPGNEAPYVANPHEHPKPGPHLDASIPEVHGPELTEHPLVDREIELHRSGQDANGVREMAHGYAHNQVHGSRKTASVQADEDLATVLAGFETTAGVALLGEALEGGGAASEAAGAEGAANAGMDKVPGMPGGGEGGSGGSVSHNLDSSSDGVRGLADNYARSQVTGSSQVPQVGSYGVGGSEGLPAETFPAFAGQPIGPNTSSDRSPALQELADFTGWDGTSVVPPNRGEAELANDPNRADADTGIDDHSAAGFPVSGSAHTASKEHSMSQAACPTCAGTGHVAVRKQAYSGLPQIDQIVNADETPGDNVVAPGQSEHYPSDVAFPLTGWGASPQQGGQNIQDAISQAEGQIADRSARSPLVTNTTASRHQANGRDNSGWIGDMGAKGTDYPGYSTPAYDGSNNLGEPDPVYGYGGDNGNQPLRPYGEMEANDETNNPSQPFDYAAPHDAGQGYRTVSPGLSTAGSRDPFIAQALAEKARLDQVIAARARQLQTRG